MTISDTATKFRYEGNASTDTFAFSGKAFTAADLVVEIITRATDALEETLTITTDYTVTINSDETATIVTVAGKIPSATQDIQIRRSLAQTQTVVLPTGTKFPAKSVENAIDRAVGLSQDLEESVTRSLKFPATSSTTVATLPEPTDDATILFDGVTGLFKIGPTSTAITGAEAQATAAAASASAASTSETNAAASAVDAAASASGVNLPSITATDTGSILQVNAAGTAHELLTAGTAGKFLMSNGADAPLSYESVTTGSLVLLETQTASTSPNITFDSTVLTTTYKKYIIELIDVTISIDGGTPRFVVSEDDGSTYKTTNEYDYCGSSVEASGSPTVSAMGALGAAAVIFTGAVVGTATGEAINGTIEMFNPLGTALHKAFIIDMASSPDNGAFTKLTMSAKYDGSVNAVNNIKLLPHSSGTFVTGTFKLYGVL